MSTVPHHLLVVPDGCLTLHTSVQLGAGGVFEIDARLGLAAIGIRQCDRRARGIGRMGCALHHDAVWRPWNEGKNMGVCLLGSGSWNAGPNK